MAEANKLKKYMTQHLMCPGHWGMVSKNLQTKVLGAYQPGQETNKLISINWRIAALEAIAEVALLEHGEVINQELLSHVRSLKAKKLTDRQT